MHMCKSEFNNILVCVLQVVRRICDLQILSDIAKSTFPVDSHELNLYLSMHHKQRNNMYVSTAKELIIVQKYIYDTGMCPQWSAPTTTSSDKIITH